MAKFTDAVKATMKSYFNAGDQPTEAQFASLIDAIQEGIEEHDHDGTEDGDGIADLGPLDSLEVADDAWIGIGAALERIVFDAAGDISVMGASVGLGTLAPAYPFHVIKLIGDAAHSWIVVENDHNDYAAIFQARNNADKTIEVLIYGNTAAGAARYGVARADNAFISATTTMAIGTSVAQGLVLGTNNVARITIAAAGAVKVASLAGVGARAVVAAADGTLSAP